MGSEETLSLPGVANDVLLLDRIGTRCRAETGRAVG